jgi:hypothetical protein
VACLKDRGLVAGRALGRANFYRLARPELASLLRAAEELLVGIVHQDELCPYYSCDRGTARASA